MASEIRVNQIQSRTGVSTVSFTDSGPIFAGISTVQGTLTVGNTVVNGGSVGIGTDIPTAKLEVVGKSICGVVSDKTNYSNVLNTATNLGTAGFRTLNLIDESAVVKLARLHPDYGPALDLQHWSTDISTLYGRALIGITSANVEITNVTEDGDIKFNTKESGVGVSSERVRITGIGSVGIGTDNVQALLHAHKEISSGYEHITSLGHGADKNFQLVTSNGSTSNSSGEPVSRLGMHYQGTGWDSYAEWRRGSTAQDGSLRFITSGGTYTPLTLNADGTSTFGGNIDGTAVSLTSNITQTSTAPQHFFRETDTTYGNTLWSLTRDSDGFSIRWNNASPYAFASQTSGGSLTNVQLKGGQIIIDGNNALDAICVYNTTTSGGANVNVASSGLIRRSTSSAKYKTNVETIEDSYSDALLNCRPVYYRSTCENDNPDYGWWGFIAEEVAEIDPRLVYYKEVNVALDGEGGKTETPCELEPEGVAYERFVPHLLNLIKRQKQAIETLESRVAALEAE